MSMAILTRRQDSRVAVNSEPWVWQNLLLTTLAVVAVPFAQKDWPNPSVPRGLQRSEFWQPSPCLNVTPPKPFSQNDWPVPRGAFRHVSQNWDLPSLLVTTLYVVPTMPCRQLDWPNPLSLRRGRPQFVQGLNLEMTVVPSTSGAIFLQTVLFGSGVPS